ncbi:MAG: DNA polymerase III subunit gamma/tau [Bacteroidetes bacterium]|nr:DNA polymerase III subunit gamma/tau [Bacteroidota bacterium]
MMAYVVTARKWRPNKFSEIVGQEHITNTLINAIKSERIAHAYLFTGPRGVGKTTTARILAKRLNCLNPNGSEPCDECEICKSVKRGQLLDIIEIDAASNRGIDEIRSLRDSVKYAPTIGKYKVYIIDEVHMLTRESFNAFLKTLEEPPEHTIFIFATTDVHKIPLTIISRCQRYDFRRIELHTIIEQLHKIAVSEKYEIDNETLTIIAKKADGALRDAESYFDQVISYCGNNITKEAVSEILNLISDDIYFDVSDAVINKDYNLVFKITETIYKNGWNFIDFFTGLIEHFRNILIVELTEKSDLIETSEANKKKYLQYKNVFSEGDLLRLLNYLNKSFQELRFTQNQKLKIEISLSHLVGLEKSTTISEIISKVNNINIEQANNSENYQPSKRNSNIVKEPNPDIKSDIPFTKVHTNQKNIEESTPEEKKSQKTIPLNYELILEKWDGFIDIVLKEKPLILGPVIQNVEVENYVDSKLNLTGIDKDGIFLLKSHKEYIEKKAFHYFGKKIHFNFTESENIGSALKKEETKNIPLKEPIVENSPIINKIIAEFGGQEIK